MPFASFSVPPSRPDARPPEVGIIRRCEQLRARADRHIPILMLTARDTLDDKLRDFAVGADDYLTKRFAEAELLARCQALSLRHRAGTEHPLCIGSLLMHAAVAGMQGRRGDAYRIQRLARP